MASPEVQQQQSQAKNDRFSLGSVMSEQGKDISITTEHTFGNEEYMCSMYTVGGNSLVVEIEQKSSCDGWRGEFSPSAIEYIAKSVGNVKKFPIFVRMLHSGFSQKSDSVSLDLLTRSELQLLYQRKSSKSFPIKDSNQRYLILTYSAEFDRVNFPLPLEFHPASPQKMREIIKTLRSQLGDKPKQENPSLLQEYEKLKRDKQALEIAFDKLRKESTHEMKVIQKECDLLSQDLNSQNLEMVSLKRKLANSTQMKQKVDSYKRKIAELTDQLELQKKVMLKKNKQIDDLKNEIENARRNSERPSSAPTSFKRFNPTEYVKSKKAKPKAKQPTPRVSSRSSSTERRQSPTSSLSKPPTVPTSRRKASLPISKSPSSRSRSISPVSREETSHFDHNVGRKKLQIIPANDKKQNYKPSISKRYASPPRSRPRKGRYSSDFTSDSDSDVGISSAGRRTSLSRQKNVHVARNDKEKEYRHKRIREKVRHEIMASETEEEHTDYSDSDVFLN